MTKKEVRANYWRSPKGKATRNRYLTSEKGKAYKARAGKKYRASKKGKAKAARESARRRSNLKAVFVNDFTADQWATMLEEHKNLCHYCCRFKKLTMDHVIPISKGGNHTVSNIVPACQSCNSSKGSKLYK